MKCILFVGTCNKENILLDTGKLLTYAEKNVLIIDATFRQRLTRLLPFSDPKAFFHQMDGLYIGTAVTSPEGVSHYVERMQQEGAACDFVLLQSDMPVFLDPSLYDHLVGVTKQERDMIIGNIELLRVLTSHHSKRVLTMHHIIADYTSCSIEENYIRHVYSEIPIVWEEPSWVILFDEVDYGIHVDSQFRGKVSIRGLSKPYQKVLYDLLARLTELDKQTIKLIRKFAKRRV
jgi:hypothetical protein